MVNPHLTMYLTVRAGETEPLIMVVGARGMDNLDNLSTAVLFLRLVGAAENHVDGAELDVVESSERTLAFDPVGAAADGEDALQDVGEYEGYVKLTWSDGDVTLHPSANELLRVEVLAGFE